MKTNTRPSAAAVALLCGVTLAAAAGTSALAAGSQDKMANPSMSKSSSLSQPMDKLSLTSAQRKSAWEDISQQAAKQKAPKDFTAKVGEALPSDLTSHPVPVSTANEVPKLRAYHYAMLDNNKLLIINPKDKKVVEVITR